MIINKETIIQLAKQGKRLDGRGLLEYRGPIELETDISWTAEGSAKVRIGETVVLAGVKMTMDKPYPDTPDEGGITFNAELLPLSSPEYEPGPPQIKGIELARVTDRGVRESKAIDFKKLCITPGEKAWFLTIDLMTINDAGNLFDVATMAALAALKNARFPVVDEKGVIDYHKKTDKHVPLVKEPIGITVYKISGHLLVDPTNQEEKSYDARLTIASDEKGIISAMQKGGDAPLTVEDISKMIDIALDKAKFLRNILNKELEKKKK
ncbi:MAG: exosome complex protein Rrp42 [Nanoarchaeota archaeon]